VRSLGVALDLLREARSRRWILALFLVTSGLLLLVAFGLELEVVDGALAASRFLGGRTSGSIRPADVALRPLFEGVAWTVYSGGLILGVLACADFAPALLAPGRIEQLLSLPYRRWELLVGTWLGVLALLGAGGLYGGVGLSLIVLAKTGLFGWAPAAAALLGVAAFAAVYAVMLLAAVAVRSAALSAAAGAGALLAFLAAGRRAELAPLFSAGPGRAAFLALTAPLPRLDALGEHAARLAAGLPAQPGQLLVHLLGTLLFAAATLLLAAFLFERKDF
jgi:Cu-processing system permease protein